ncbi:uncharacterized protein BDV14DRAFT_23424 [Aspergillus stella-maris]|uniref:uncharacterized protein n=1 Tax=Aspergillus stella-maris TaxID=1810926 RepID=UPI003CCC9CD6
MVSSLLLSALSRGTSQCDQLIDHDRRYHGQTRGYFAFRSWKDWRKKIVITSVYCLSRVPVFGFLLLSAQEVLYV